MNELIEEIKNCKECPEGVKEFGWGFHPGTIMFIGSCPSPNNPEGLAGTSAFDKFFIRLIAKAGIKLEDFYFTNLVKNPGMIDQHGWEIIRHTGTHLLKEIEIVKPRIIITLGKYVRMWAEEQDFGFESMAHPASMKYHVISEADWLKRLRNIVKRHNG